MDRHQLPALSGPQYSVRVVIDYPAALALRQMALVQDDLPKYLLAPEVSALLRFPALLRQSVTRARPGAP